MIRFKDFLRENKDITHDSIIDNEKGLGHVPNNSDVDYRGKRIKMTPSKFLSLAKHLPKEEAKSYDHISNHIKSGGKIASPFLNIAVHDDWRNGDLSKPPKVISHEGRNRMYAIRDTLGDEPTEVHLFFNGYRNKHITPEWIDRVHDGLRAEKT